MFEPKYQMTGKLLKNLTEIERLYGQIESLRLPTQLGLSLERKNLLQSTYISNSIEGNPLNLPEVTNLLLGDRVPVNRDEKEVKNYFEILKNLEKLATNIIDVDVLLNIHKKLMTGVRDDIAGIIRNTAVIIGGRDIAGKLRIQHNPPFHDRENISREIIELMDWINIQDMPVPLKAGLWHHQFVYLHPFVDGNGRVCRLTTALVFLHGKFLINKYFVLDDYYDIDRSEYSQKLHTADSGNKTIWLEYFTDGVKFSLMAALEKAKTALLNTSASIMPTEKEKEVLKYLDERGEISSEQVADNMKISRQQAHKFLLSLVNKGWIIKKGVTKGSIYIRK